MKLGVAESRQFVKNIIFSNQSIKVCEYYKYIRECENSSIIVVCIKLVP